MSPSRVSSGIDYLDRLINSFTIGDNVVWHVETGAFVELFCRAFITSSVRQNKDVVYVSFNNSPKNILAKIGPAINNENVVIVDCFTSGKGERADIFLDLYKTAYKAYKCTVIHIQNPGDMTQFISAINAIEEDKPRGTRYVFDSMTGMQDLCGSSEQVVKLFTRQCPRLYELDTIAYWILEKNAHSDQFRAQINHITQDVIDLAVDDGACVMSVIKAENHPESGMLKKHRYEVVDGMISFVDDPDAGTASIGHRIRALRQKKEISQAQLAKTAGVTPSTISQVESNTITVSLPVLVRLARALNSSVGDLFDEDRPRGGQFIFRAKDRVMAAGLADGVACAPAIAGQDNPRVSVDVITIEPGTETDASILPIRGMEVGYMVSGMLELTMNRRAYTINEGDIVCFSAEVPSRWKNNAECAARLLWVAVR